MKVLITMLISWFVYYVFAYLFANRKRFEWFRWVLYSCTHLILLKRLKKDLNAWGEAGIIQMVVWLESDRWYKKYWFGRCYKKTIVRKLKTLAK